MGHILSKENGGQRSKSSSFGFIALLRQARVIDQQMLVFRKIYKKHQTIDVNG